MRAITTASALAAGLGGIAAFQVALAAGAPLGRAAYGGFSTDLSPTLRAISTGAVVFWSAAAVVVLRRLPAR